MSNKHTCSAAIQYTSGQAVVSVDVLGCTLRLQQSSTPVLGTTVWDSSIVQLRYIAATRTCRQAIEGAKGKALGCVVV